MLPKSITPSASFVAVSTMSPFSLTSKVKVSSALSSRPSRVFTPLKVMLPVASYTFVKVTSAPVRSATALSVPFPLSLTVTVIVYSLVSAVMPLPSPLVSFTV